jgi:hypothetical protein
MNRTIIGWLAFLAGMFVVGYAASPFFAAQHLYSVAQAGDADRIEGAVDFRSVRENLKSELSAKMTTAMADDPKMKDNPFAGIGALLMPTILDRMVDGYVTPAGVAEIIRNGELHEKERAEPAKEESKPVTKMEKSYEYLGLDRFRVRLSPSDDTAKHVDLVFDRRGLFTWKLVRIGLPDFKAPALSDQR